MKNSPLKLLFLLNAFLLLLQLPTGAQEFMRISLNDGSTIVVALSDIQKLTFDIPTGVNEQRELVKQLLKLKAFPNPAKDYVILDYSLNEKGYVCLEVFNSCGDLILSKATGLQTAGNHHYQWLLSDVPPGLYICRISQNKNIASEKIIVKK